MVLVVDGRVVAPAEVAGDRRARARGLLGRTHLDGALWLPRTRSVHTFGMAFALDVALCRPEGVVVATLVLPPGRVTRPRRGAVTVVEAPAGSFAAWGLRAGSRVAVVSPPGAPPAGRSGWPPRRGAPA